MKKLLIVLCAAIVLTAGLVLYNYFSLPDHVRSQEEESTSSSAVDSRVQSAVESNQKSLMEGKGIDLPLSGDLLQMMNQYWKTNLADKGAGLYQGTINDHLVVEMLLNEEGNVGQVQLCFTLDASVKEQEEGLMQYIRFLNQEINETDAGMAASEAQAKIEELEEGKKALFYKYDVGFAMKRDAKQLFIYIP